MRRARPPDPSTPSRAPPERNLSSCTLIERVQELEAGGYWSVSRARAIVEEAGAGTDWTLAVRALHAFESAGFYAPRTLSTCVLQLLSVAGRVDECAQLLERLFLPTVSRGDARYTFDPDIVARRRPNARMVVVAANTAVRLLHVDAAVNMVAMMRRHDVAPNSHVYSVLIKGFGRTGRADDVAATLDIALRAPGLAPDLALYNTAVDAYVRCGDLQRARVAMRAAEKAGFALDSRSYSPLFRALAHAGRLSDAFSLVNEMTARGIKPSAITLNLLIQAAVSAREWPAARRLLTRALEMSGGVWTRQKVVAYTSLIAGLADTGDIAGATALLAELASRLPAPDGARGAEEAGALSVPLAAVLSALLEQGTVDEAVALFRRMQRRLRLALAPDAYVAVIRGLARRADRTSLAGAARLLAEMRESFWRDARPTPETRGRASLPAELCMAHNALMDGLVRAGRMEEAEAVLASMSEAALLPNAVSYTIVLNGFGLLGDVRGAERVLRDMRMVGVRPDRVTMNTMLGACVRAGEVGSAERVFETMKREGKELKPDITSYSALLAAYARCSDVDKAWLTYHAMKEEGLVPNEKIIDRMLSLYVAKGARAVAVQRSMAAGEGWAGARTVELLKDMQACECSPKLREKWTRVLASVA